MSKEAVAKLKNDYEKIIWKNDKSMIDYSWKKISDCYETEQGFLIEFEKPTIKKDFCFGYDDWTGIDDANKMADNAETNENYFINQNLKDINRLIKNLKESKAYARQTFVESNLSNLVFEGYIRTYEFEKENCIELSETDVKGLIAMAENEKVKFEKRLRTYLKKYGLSKLNVWTYWRD